MRFAPLLTVTGFLLLLFAGSCGKSRFDSGQSKGGSAKDPVASRDFDLTNSVSAPRLAAFGDVHGDLNAAQKALRLAGAIDGKNHWKGGRLAVVQTGDAIDRADDDRAIMDFFADLRKEAKSSGGAFITLVGNHEIMNVYGDLRFITRASFLAFDNLQGLNLQRRELARVPQYQKKRAAAFLPGGPYAKQIADNKIAVMIKGTIFVHGGLLPWHLSYGIDRINNDARDWMQNKLDKVPSILASSEGPTWTRLFSLNPGALECSMLDSVLRATRAKRRIVGHQIQREGISSACNGKIWRIDVGLSRFFGGQVEILEITGKDEVIVKKAPLIEQSL